jgi:hypothetical protein
MVYSAPRISSTSSNLKEIVFVLGHCTIPIYELKYTKYVRFFKPESRPWLPWQAWKYMEAHWTEQFPGSCVVRIMEAEIV